MTNLPHSEPIVKTPDAQIVESSGLAFIRVHPDDSGPMADGVRTSQVGRVAEYDEARRREHDEFLANEREARTARHVALICAGELGLSPTTVAAPPFDKVDLFALKVGQAHSQVQKQTGADVERAVQVDGPRPRLQWLAAAMMLVKAHPDWSDRRVANDPSVGKHPATVARSPEYRRAAALARQRPTPPRGFVQTNADGTRRVDAADFDVA